ncbi:MAG: short-chain dehydrogenase [Alphaproteobacteria bacterium]|nr:MAG: short-chain dehydrogenase [Alphaproteobacteria bacterium]
MNSAFLSLGFRPFFLGAGIWACLAMGIWLAALAGMGVPPTHLGLFAWHAHEMIFGFAAAVISGFALTAVPEWTGRPPIRGGALGCLFALWVAGRVAMALSAIIGPLSAALIDGAFLAVLCAVIAREIIKAGNRRNLVIALALALLFVANVVVHAGALGEGDGGALGLRLGLAVVVFLIMLVGGRVTPAFTGNWLARAGADRLPAPFGWIDGGALGVGALALGAWVAAPGALATALLLLAAAGLHGLRLVRWRGAATAPEPLVWILHLGYAWLPVGLAALGLAYWGLGLTPGAALHGLSIGAIGTMTLAVMTRATLGHTGRPLAAGRGTVVAYVLVTAAAVPRLAAGAEWAAALPLSFVAGGLWIAGFGLFVLLYGPMHLAAPVAAARSDDG